MSEFPALLLTIQDRGRGRENELKFIEAEEGEIIAKNLSEILDPTMPEEFFFSKSYKMIKTLLQEKGFELCSAGL